MRLAFITNHERTEAYYRIAEGLEAKGHAIFWITGSDAWQRRLTRRGVAADHILNLGTFAQQWRRKRALTEGEIEHLRQLEQAGGRSMTNLILNDRLLRRRPPEYALRYLATAARLVEDFLLSRQITTVSGEATWALELLTAFLCLHHGLDWRVLHTIRMPSERQAFFTHIDQYHLLDWREPDAADRQAAEAWYLRFQAEPVQPCYMQHSPVVRPRWRWIRRGLHHLRHYPAMRMDEMALTLPHLLRMRLGNWLRALGVKLWGRQGFESAAPYLDQPYVLVPLHVQPEASIDVLGGSITDQRALVRALAENLPAGMPLLVKPHPNALGLQGPGYYRALRAIPGVRLIRPQEPMPRLIRQAACVVSVSGTACFEAALLGIPAACTAPVFFESLLALPRLNPYSDRLREFLQQPPSTPASAEESIRLLTRLRAISFERHGLPAVMQGLQETEKTDQ